MFSRTNGHNLATTNERFRGESGSSGASVPASVVANGSKVVFGRLVFQRVKVLSAASVLQTCDFNLSADTITLQPHGANCGW